MTKLELRKVHKEGLGRSLSQAGFDPREFKLGESATESEKDSKIRLTHKDSGETLDIILFQPSEDDESSAPFYNVRRKLLEDTHTDDEYEFAEDWEDVLANVSKWAQVLRREIDAEDPWSEDEQETIDDMESNDENFSADELPRIDRGIDAVIKELEQVATDQGGDVKAIKESLDQVATILKSTARSSSKREWLTAFKAIIASEVVKWGLENNVIGGLVHTLITASQDIAQLAEHASRLNL